MDGISSSKSLLLWGGYGEAIVRDTASVESHVFEIDEVEFIYVPWTHVQGARDRFAFHMYHRKGRFVKGWRVTDESIFLQLMYDLANTLK